MIRATGLLEATEDQRRRAPRWGSSARGLAAALSPDFVQQTIARIVDQRNRPACVGAAMCACAESVLGIPPRRSWISIWRDARRRHGEILDYTAGTWFAYAVASAIQRGFDVEEPGEWDDIDEMTEPDDLASELSAHDTRQQNTEHWRVPDGELDALDDALARGLCAAMGGGVRDPYFGFFRSPRSAWQPDQVLGTDYLGGYQDGHEQRIAGVERVGGVRQYILQNSWGENGGCHLLDGTFQLGCARVNEAVIRAAWDVDVIRITRRAP